MASICASGVIGVFSLGSGAGGGAGVWVLFALRFDAVPLLAGRAFALALPGRAAFAAVAFAAAGGTGTPTGCCRLAPGEVATAVGGWPQFQSNTRKVISRRPSGPSNTALRASSEVRRQAGCD